MIRASAADGSCDKFIDLSDISHAARALDTDLIHLHPEDAISTKIWVEKLKEEEISIFYKDRLDSSPPGLPMHSDQLLLCIQTSFCCAFRPASAVHSDK